LNEFNRRNWGYDVIVAKNKASEKTETARRMGNALNELADAYDRDIRESRSIAECQEIQKALANDFDDIIKKGRASNILTEKCQRAFRILLVLAFSLAYFIIRTCNDSTYPENLWFIALLLVNEAYILWFTFHIRPKDDD
jgi:E3 ubiquitin-protein ligase DOA10